VTPDPTAFAHAPSVPINCEAAPSIGRCIQAFRVRRQGRAWRAAIVCTAGMARPSAQGQVMMNRHLGASAEERCENSAREGRH
jgi:hypothetical protein